MWNEILKSVLPVIVVAVITILCKVGTELGNAAISLLEQKLNESKIKEELAKHEKELKVGKEIWGLVDEQYRITENAKEIFGEKRDYFDKLLKEKIPYLTDEEIMQLRQVVAGVMNKGKEVVIEQLPEDTKK